LREDLSKWPSIDDCHDKYKDGTEDDDFHTITAEEAAILIDVFAATNDFNNLFMGLDTNSTRKEANRKNRIP
jgi:hypothetical protein